MAYKVGEYEPADVAFGNTISVVPDTLNVFVDEDINK